jgi:hypothetical protein
VKKPALSAKQKARHQIDDSPRERKEFRAFALVTAARL